MGTQLSDSVENIVEKGEIAPFPTMFSKAVFRSCVNTCIYGIKV